MAWKGHLQHLERPSMDDYHEFWWFTFKTSKVGLPMELHIISKTITNDFTMLMTSPSLSSSGKSGQIAFVTNDTNQSVLVPFNSVNDFF